ncbi:molecular chaperone TorD family protein [Halococcus saccharolyticus]|uniref:Chaperone protein n=1 Tax=Halococcus saccharolyticus DSM 5350 TaxID=1227455 RepID=M0MMU7_9EURY|nr:molecular chaperone TorD family protein [Halococcus saccharolyticus]EMA46049.1 chaperone protein [Halococcus saccharolyticus DSM 5350]
MTADVPAPEPDDPPLDREDLEPDAAARGTVYALLASAFEHPTESLHTALAEDDLREHLDDLLARTPLDVATEAVGTDDDYDTFCARYNDLFVIGYSEYEDRTDGTLSTDEPPVPLYESAYRPEASWTDVNLDLARAYDYYGVRPASSNREHHDYLVLQLEFAGYLARREAVEDGPDAARARLDLLDRHLRILVEGVVERIDNEPNTGAYGRFARLLDEFTATDREELLEQLEGE